MGRRFDSVRFGIGVLAIASLTGCGGNGRPKTVPVTGRITLDGHEPGDYGKIFFAPTQAAEGYSRRPASGSFDSEGTYTVMSWEANDGLVPGHYTVHLVPIDPMKSTVPKKYMNDATSGLEVDVSPDKDTIEYNIELRSK